jgi:hypothetical protein
MYPWFATLFSLHERSRDSPFNSQRTIKGYTKDSYNCEKGDGDKKGAADKKRDNDENNNDEKRNV